MSVYLIAQIRIHDRERYGTYEAGFMEIFQKYRGKMLAVDEAHETLEGEWPWTRTVLIEFPTPDDATAWYHSDEYQRLAQHRLAASEANITIIQSLSGS